MSTNIDTIHIGGEWLRPCPPQPHRTTANLPVSNTRMSCVKETL